MLIDYHQFTVIIAVTYDITVHHTYHQPGVAIDSLQN